MIHETGAGRIRVLVVDDHRLSRQFTVAALRQTGCTVKQARSAHEAVQLARDWRPAVVLLDWHLGDGNGGDVARRLRQCWPRGSELPRLVLLTGEAQQRLPTGVAACGFERILAKPLDAAELARAVRCSTQPHAVNETGEPFDLRMAFAAEVQRRLPVLDAAIADRNTAKAAATIHQLIAGSAMSGEHGLESELRALNDAVLNDPLPDAVADAWCRLCRVAEDFLDETTWGN